MAGRSTICCMFLILSLLYQLRASKDDKAANQLPKYAEKHPDSPPLTSDGGQPLDTDKKVLSVGPNGPLLMDPVYIGNVARLDRERIPERVVHARGSGAFGYFEVTHDITKFTKAIVFDKVGKKTPIAVRFSFATGEHGTPETIRDIRGFAVKFYTENGIWDIVGNNFPMYFFRDPSLIIGFVHAIKRNPKTNLLDMNAFWDFFCNRPETVHGLLQYFSDQGIPDGYRHIDGFGVNTFKFVNDENEISYVKFTYKTNQGLKNLFADQAVYISAMDPNYATRDLYNAIEKKEYPSWTLYIQVMPAEDADKYRWNPFDPTKVWYEKDYPLLPVGKLVLNKNPTNYFQDVEQIAFCPSNLIPGIESTYDKILQGRFFSYADTQRYRLGTNYFQLPVNMPKNGLPVNNYNRDGGQVYFNQGDQPNYDPNSYKGPRGVPSAASSEYNVSGIVKRWELGGDDNYSQARIYWNEELKPDERERWVQNVVPFIKPAEKIQQERVVQLFSGVSEELAEALTKPLGLKFEDVKPK